MMVVTMKMMTMMTKTTFFFFLGDNWSLLLLCIYKKNILHTLPFSPILFGGIFNIFPHVPRAYATLHQYDHHNHFFFFTLYENRNVEQEQKKKFAIANAFMLSLL